MMPVQPRDLPGGPAPAFSQPWHAQIFALTVHLHDRGMFDWPDWTARFGAVLARHRARADRGDCGLDGEGDYYAAWLEAFELLLTDLRQAAPEEVVTLRDAWAQAYLDTPHGAPVRLPPA